MISRYVPLGLLCMLFFLSCNTVEIKQVEELDDNKDIIKDFIKEGKTFDSIYFDTYVFNFKEYPQWAPFTKVVPKLLNPNGIYSYFNDTASKI